MFQAVKLAKQIVDGEISPFLLKQNDVHAYARSMNEAHVVKRHFESAIFWAIVAAIAASLWKCAQPEILAVLFLVLAVVSLGFAIARLVMCRFSEPAENLTDMAKSLYYLVDYCGLKLTECQTKDERWFENWAAVVLSGLATAHLKQMEDDHRFSAFQVSKEALCCQNKFGNAGLAIFRLGMLAGGNGDKFYELARKNMAHESPLEGEPQSV